MVPFFDYRELFVQITPMQQSPIGETSSSTPQFKIEKSMHIITRILKEH
jgi:hypothetical protein